MTYEENIEESLSRFCYMQEKDNLCFECGKVISNAVVRYEGYYGKENIKSISFHPACATIVGQRLIADGYTNRNK